MLRKRVQIENYQHCARLFGRFQRQQKQLQRSLDNSESERRDTFPSAMLIEYQTHWVGTHVAYQTT